MHNKKSLLIILISILVFILGAIGIVVWVVNTLSQNEALTTKIIKYQIERLLDLDSAVEHPHAYIDWDLQYKIRADKLTFIEKNRDLVSVEDIKLNVFIPYLLLRKIYITEMTGNNLFANIERWENNKINIIEIFNITGFFKIYFRNSSISVNHYFFKFVDQYHKPNETMVISGNNILFSKFTLKKYFQLIMDGNIAYNKTSTPFMINANAKIPTIKKDYNLELVLPEFNAKTFKTYFQEYDKNIDISGEGNIHAKVFGGRFFHIYTTLKNSKLKTDKIKYSFDFKDTFSLQTKFGLYNNDVTVDEFHIFGKDFDAFTKGKIFHINKLPVDVDLFIKVKEGSSGNSLLKLSPSGIQALNYIIDKAKKQNAGGIISGEATVKGHPKHFIVNGKVHGEHLNLGYGYDYPNSTVDLNFQGEKMFVDTIYHHNYNKNEFTKLSGNIKITEPYCFDLKVKTSDNIDFVTGSKALKIYSHLFHFPLGPISATNVEQGRGEAYLTIKQFPPNILLNGKLTFRNAKGSYPGFYGDMENVFGEVDFNGDTIVYKNLKGTHNGVNTYYHGQTEIHNNALTHVYIDIPDIPIDYAKVYIDNSPLMLQVSKATKFIKNPNGKGNLSMVLVAEKDKQPYSQGTFKVTDGYCDIDKLAYPAKNVTGRVDFTSTQSNLDFEGTLNDIYTTLKGVARTNYSNLTIATPKANIKNVFDVLNDSALFSKMQINTKDFHDFSGIIKSVSRLRGNFTTEDIDFYTDIDIVEGKLKYLDLPDYIDLTGGHLSIAKDKVLINNIQGLALNTRYKFNGIVTNVGQVNEHSDLKFEMKNLTITELEKIVGSKLFTSEVNEFLSDFDFKSGSIDLVSHIGNKLQAEINFNNATVCYKKSGEMINVKSGKFLFSDNLLKLKDIDIVMENSHSVIDGVIENYADKPKANLTITSTLAQEDFNKTLVPMLKLPFTLTGNIYMNINYNGTLDNWHTKIRAMLEDGAYITYKTAHIGEDLSKYMFFNIEKDNDDIIINTFDVFGPNTHFSSSKEDILAEIKGRINNISSKEPSFDNLKVRLNDYMNISFLNLILYDNDEDKPVITDGQIKGHVTLNGKISDPDILGKAEVRNAFIPSINTTLEKVSAEFKEKLVQLKDTTINIAGSKADIEAVFENDFVAPTVINELYVKSDYINIDNILQNFTTLFATNEATHEHKKNNNYKEATTPPFIIEKGDFDVKTLIYNGLAINNASADFKVNPDWNCEVNNIKANITTGTLEGDVKYNLKTTELTGNIAAEKVMANAIASSFMNLPNEISGNMDLNISFSTKGAEHDEMIKNLNGFALFRLDKGRMLRLGSIEYMLRIANTLKGGLTRLNLNAVVNIVAPRTGYFDTIEGDLKIENGIIMTDRITSTSNELNLFLTGIYNMNTSNVNGTIIGQMPMESKESILWLGPIGKISMRSLVRQLTREGSEKNNENPFLRNPQAYINTIPGLTSNKSHYRFFVITLKGDLYSDKYVEQFKWIK